VVCALGAAVVAVAGAAHAGVPPSQSVTDAAGRFTLSIPSTWRVQQNAPGVALLAVAPTRRDERVPANVNVAVDELPSPMPVAEYAAKAAETLKTGLRGYTVVQQGNTVVDDHPVAYRYYTWVRSDGVGLYQVQMYATVNQRGFVVTGTTENIDARIRRDVPVLVQILDTFHPGSAQVTHAGVDVPGALATAAAGINDAGQIVGNFVDPARWRHGFLRSVRGAFTTIDGPGATETALEGINSAGQTVGYFVDVHGRRHGFLRSPGGRFVTIDVPNAMGTSANAINDAGQIVGTFGDASGPNHAFLRSAAGTLTTIDAPGARVTNANGINDDGQIVGRTVDATGHTHGFLRFPAGAVSLIDVPGSTESDLGGINEVGEIVGTFQDTAGRSHGFARTPTGTFVTIDMPGATATNLNDVNSNGQIVGMFVVAKTVHGYLQH